MYKMTITLFSRDAAESLDQRLPEIFKNGTARKPRNDSVTLQTLQDIVELPGYTYSFTVTLDRKKPLFKKELINEPKKQWRHIKKVLLTNVDKYRYRSIFAPEFHKNSTCVHAHGIVHFKVDNYDDALYYKAMLVRKLHRECGKMIQWTRINQSVGMYMPIESNVKIKTKQSLQTWHIYMHKSEIRKKLGIQDLFNF